MKRSGARVAMTIALVASLSATPEAWAISKIGPNGVVTLQDTGGAPLQQQTVTIVFNDQKQTTKTDDDGRISFLLIPSGGTTPKDSGGRVVLIGDGPGLIIYGGGGNDSFTVSGGRMTLTGGSQAKEGFQIGPREVAIGGGGLLVLTGGLIALSGGDDNDTITPGNVGGGSTGPTFTGTRTCGAQVQQGGNPSGHPITIPAQVRITVTQQGQLLTVTSSEPNFVTVSGPVDNNTLAFNGTGNGAYAGFPTLFTMVLNFSNNGQSASGVYSAGTDGRLPGGGAIRFAFTCVTP